MKSAKANRELALARLRVNWKHSAQPYRSCVRGAMHSQNKLAVKWQVVVKSRNLYSSPHALLENVHLSVISRGWSCDVFIFKGERWREESAPVSSGFFFFPSFFSWGHSLSVNYFIMLCFFLIQGCWNENPNTHTHTHGDMKNRHFISKGL